MVVARSWQEGGENRELVFNVDRVSVWKDKVLEVDGGDGCTV